MASKTSMSPKHGKQSSSGSLSSEGTIRVSRDDDRPRRNTDESVAPKSRTATLWVHEDNFSKEEVLINFNLFEGRTLRDGDLIQITALKSTTAAKDFSTSTPESSNSRGGEGYSYYGVDHMPRPAAITKALEDSYNVDEKLRYCFTAHEMPAELRAKQKALQVSLHSTIASSFGFRSRSQVVVTRCNKADHTATHIELIFRDEYLARSDMWRLICSELAGKTVYKGQKILFLGTIKATVNAIFLNGMKVPSAYFAKSTVPVFRSESARYVLFIQMSKEMWDFDSEGTGEIIFNRVINGFLPELFKRWQRLDVKHLVSIVMFGRLEYDHFAYTSFDQVSEGFKRVTSMAAAETSGPQDFYRVVVTDMASGQWTTILNEMKKEFRVFLRDVMLHKPASNRLSFEKETNKTEPEQLIRGRPSSALRGNILEAINIASSQFASDYIDRDLVRTGISVVVITPGTGVFEVDRNLLNLTSENLTNNGIGVDIVCLSKMPLHSVPLFKYRDQNNTTKRNRFESSVANGSPRGLRAVPNSFSNQLGASPGTPFGSVPKPVARYNSQSDFNEDITWAYGIPQWIDLSYWSPAGGGLEYAQAKRKYYLDPGYVQKFEPRVRMYELQMMGVMEFGQADLSIPYMTEDILSHFHRSLSHVYADSSSPEKGRKSVKQLRERRAESIYASRYRQSSLKTQQQKDDERRRLMESYDNKIFTFTTLGRQTTRKEQRTNKKQSEEQPRRKNAKVVSTLTSGLNEASQTSSTKKAREKPDRKDHASSRADSRDGPVLAAVKPSITSKSSRSISLALRGLAPVARASASTGLQIETAKALPSYFPERPHSGASDKDATNDVESSKVMSHYSTDSSNSDDPDVVQHENTVRTSRPISIQTPTLKAQENSATSRPQNLPVVANSAKKHALEATLQANTESHHETNVDTSSGASDESDSDGDVSTLPQDISPWIKNVHPSNPKKNSKKAATWVGKWQHLYPKPPRVAKVKWRSLCTPASVPLTTEDFPSRKELESQYKHSTYAITIEEGDQLVESPKSEDMLLREMIAVRLAHGYQIVVGDALADATKTQASAQPNVFDISELPKSTMPIYLVMGDSIQKLHPTSRGRVQVTQLVREASEELPQRAKSITYLPVIKTILSQSYLPRPMQLAGLSEQYPWKIADQYLAKGSYYEDKLVDELRFWRARFVLIPVEPPANQWRPLQATNEESEEEIHLLGIRALTQMWQKSRFVPPAERVFKSNVGGKKDSNPLEVNFQTLDPSEVVAMEIEKSLATERAGEVKSLQLLPESEQMTRSTSNISKLGQVMQGEKGVEIVTRRWHLRLHYNCFKGDDFTTWLLSNFKDIDTREEAVAFGNELMEHGLFQHVEKRHIFKDGNYFYQIDTDHRLPRVDSKSSGGWFSGMKRSNASVPPTPVMEKANQDPFAIVTPRSAMNSATNHSKESSLEQKVEK